ncbi:MAG: DUF3775 domain-containing protein [Pseudomonadota bacterium]
MLSLTRETLDWIVLKAQAFDAKDMDTMEEGGEDDGADALSVLEDRPDDATEAELHSWIDDLNDRQAAELVALYWVGRGDREAEEFAEVVEDARAAKTAPTSDYLMGVPLLGTYLEAGIDKIDALDEKAAQLEDEL